MMNFNALTEMIRWEYSSLCEAMLEMKTQTSQINCATLPAAAYKNEQA